MEWVLHQPEGRAAEGSRRRTALERIMWSTLFWICVGIFIGWNLPQPTWAKSLQDKVVAAIKGAGNQRGS